MDGSMYNPPLPDRLTQAANEIDGHVLRGACPGTGIEEVAPKCSTILRSLVACMGTNDKAILDELRKLDVTALERAVADYRARAEAKGVVPIV